jgi:arabinogalactan endo-1,4-beta-galactosidase
MLHFAGISGSDWFFSKVATIDYDYIGLSYYPIWHGTNLTNLQNTMTTLGQLYNKKVIIAETAYPFTLNWNDWTNNIIGLPSQILPAFQATETGQRDFLVTQSSIKLSRNIL